jgi:histidinol-phosphate aminotransferase
LGLGVDLNDDFEIDLNAMLHSIETHQPKLIFIAYPNNPTGNTFDRAVIEEPD